MQRCPMCGRENAADARFCSNCGSSLATRVGAEERRHVTALFADLVGSTGIGERLDPEVMRGLVGRFFELASEAVRSHGGTVEKFAGDAVLALFGVAVSHEDDAERAIRAALAIRDGVIPIGEDAASRHEVTVGVRIGVESGEVVVGDPFGGATMATGDVLNVAARLEQQAAPGTVVVGPEAHGATRYAVRFEPAGEQSVRGREGGVTAWVALDAVPDLGGERGVPGLRAPLTGRADELDALIAAQRRTVRERKPVLFTLIGVPGIGKSRLVREATERMAADGARVVRGRSLPYGEAITYWAVGEMVRDLAGIGPDLSTEDAVERLRAIAPETGVAEQVAVAVGLAADGGGATGAAEIAWGVRRFMERVAERQPLVIVFEDIHWAQPALLDLIEHLATWARQAAVLIVCTSRPELLDTRAGWGSGRLEASRIHLEALGREDSSALLRALLDIDELPEELRDRVLDHAEGNPLFVEEVIRMLIDRDLVERRNGRWVAAKEARDVTVPDSVEAIIRARLDTLPRQERSLLQVASVMGRTFERSAVAVLLDDGEPVQQRLEAAVLRDLVSEEPDPEPSYRFKHILVRDVAYASLPKARRARLHARVAAWLAGRGRADELLDIRAYHLEQAVLLDLELDGRADPALIEEATETLGASAERAAAREDYRAAESFASRALGLPPPAGGHSLDARWRLVAAVYGQQSLERVESLGAELARDAEVAGRLDIMGRALVARTYAVWVGKESRQGVVAARDLLEQAAAALAKAGDLAWLYEAEYSLGFVGWWEGSLDKAIAGWEQARDSARRIGDPALEARAVSRLARTYQAMGQAGRAIELVDVAVRLAEQSGGRAARADAYVVRGHSLAVSGAFDEAVDSYAAAHALWEEIGDLVAFGSTGMSMGRALVLAGKVGQAIPLLRRSLEALERSGHTGYLPECEQALAIALLENGDIDEAEVHALAGVELVAPDDLATVANTGVALGQVRAAQGRDAEAEALLRQAVEVIDRTDFRKSHIEVPVALAEFLASRGRDEEAEAWAERARTIAKTLTNTGAMVDYVDRRMSRARAAHASGRPTIEA